MKKTKLLLILLGAALNVHNLYALSPVTAAKLAENVEKQSKAETDGFNFVDMQIARPYSDATDAIKAELWRNDVTHEAVIILNTKKVNGSLDLMGVASKILPYDQTITHTREQGRIYNELAIKNNHPELAGGKAQKLLANVVGGVVSGVYGLGRGLGYVYSKGKEAVIGKAEDQPRAEAQPNEVLDENEKKQLKEIRGIDEKLLDSAEGLFKDLNGKILSFSGKQYKTFVVGHCLGGYYAQYVAYVNRLDGFSFAAIGLGLSDNEAKRGNAGFVNYHRLSDKFSDLKPKHYGNKSTIDDLSIDVVDNLQDQINTLNIKDSPAIRMSIMGEYLTKNHAIDGYASQIKEKVRTQKKAEVASAPVSSSSSSVSSNAVASFVEAPVAQPLPVKREISNVNNDDDAPAAEVSGENAAPIAPPPAPKLPAAKKELVQQSAGSSNSVPAAPLKPEDRFDLIRKGVKLKKSEGSEKFLAKNNEPVRVVDESAYKMPYLEEYEDFVKKPENRIIPKKPNSKNINTEYYSVSAKIAQMIKEIDTKIPLAYRMNPSGFLLQGEDAENVKRLRALVTLSKKG